MSEPAENGSRVLSFEYPDAELVFGIVCAVGTDYRPVVDYLKNLLRRARYSVEEVHVSDLFPEIAAKLALKLEFPEGDEYARIDTRMKAGNAIRHATKDPGFLALDIASRIFSSRPGNDGDEPEALPHSAHIIISLKREEEVETLRKIYRQGFFLIGVFASEQERRDYLENEQGIYAEQLSELIERDQKEEKIPLGQRTRDTFEHADVFVSLKGDEYKQVLRRFLQLVFGFPYATPTREEYGMFLAYSASARSGALGRQVGAAILSAAGDVLALGCNDVPAPGGGLYWEEDGPNDQRDHKRGDGEDSNDAQKRQIVKSALEKFDELAHAEANSDATRAAVEGAVSSAIADITEFGRSVHAEMDAISTCARNGIAIAGSTLFTTTFPCHTCTRHIIAAGIQRVVYIEPYPKSQAAALHGDAICMGRRDEGGNGKKIPFEPFVGIGPRRFFDLFSLKLSTGYRVERKLQGKIVKWRLETDAKPRVPMPPTSYIQREQVVSKAIVEIYNRKGPSNVGSESANEDGRGVLEPHAEDGSPRRKVATMETRRDVKPGEPTGTAGSGPKDLFPD